MARTFERYSQCKPGCQSDSLTYLGVCHPGISMASASWIRLISPATRTSTRMNTSATVGETSIFRGYVESVGGSYDHMAPRACLVIYLASIEHQPLLAIALRGRSTMSHAMRLYPLMACSTPGQDESFGALLMTPPLKPPLTQPLIPHYPCSHRIS